MDDRALFFEAQYKDSANMKDYRKNYVMPQPYDESPAVNLSAMRENRDMVFDRLGEDSAQVKWYDRKLAELNAS